MVKDKFYRDMTDSQLRAAHREMKRNMRFEEGTWKYEYELMMNVAKERGLDLEDDSISAKLETTKDYLEFNNQVRSEDPVEYVVSNRGGRREGAGRPSLGTTRKVSITLPDEIWEQLEDAKSDKSMSAFLREIIINGNWI
ncbi:MAG TPA: hypothetical protein VKZ80_00660 [Flavobacterium sp.]|nr:hypothetical protein [Flavobacterium sp.]